MNFAADETCKRCGAELGEAQETNAADYGAMDEGEKSHSVIKRVLVTSSVIVALLFAFYVSLLVTSDPVSFEQKQTIHRAIKVLEEKGFAGEAFVLNNLVNYRATDNWWNRYVGHSDAYAATNFPFEVVTLYPDFFNVPVDDVERAMVLLHESQHLRGKGEQAAFGAVWRDKARLGWTQEKYGSTRAWNNVREFTANYAPELFRCGLDAQTDCAR
ncbi:MAG: hypothetical protein ABR577_18190 [Pyrinomonadaceae bacterium]